MKFSQIILAVCWLVLIEFFPTVLSSQPLIYAISVDWPLYRSQLIRYYPNGTMNSNVFVEGQNLVGTVSAIRNIKGICHIKNTGSPFDGKYLVTTGIFNPDPYFDEKLLEINPNTSSATIIGPPLMATLGTVRDICFIWSFPGIIPGIYGIKGGNELVRFNFNGTTFNPPISIGFFTGSLPIGYSVWGMTWTLCGGIPELIITARGSSNLVKYYKCNPNTGTLTYVGDILPTTPAVFSLAHCGIGWFATGNELWVNGIDNTYHLTSYKFGQSMVAPWCPGNSTLVTAVNSPWSGRNIEDFCSEL